MLAKDKTSCLRILKKDVEKVRAIVVPTYVLVEAKIRDKCHLNEKMYLIYFITNIWCLNVESSIVRKGP